MANKQHFYTNVEMAALEFIQTATDDVNDASKIRQSIRNLIEALIESQLLKLPPCNSAPHATPTADRSGKEAAYAQETC